MGVQGGVRGWCARVRECECERENRMGEAFEREGNWMDVNGRVRARTRHVIRSFPTSTVGTVRTSDQSERMCLRGWEQEGGGTERESCGGRLCFRTCTCAHPRVDQWVDLHVCVCACVRARWKRTCHSSRQFAQNMKRHSGSEHIIIGLVVLGWSYSSMAFSQSGRGHQLCAGEGGACVNMCTGD